MTHWGIFGKYCVLNFNLHPTLKIVHKSNLVLDIPVKKFPRFFRLAVVVQSGFLGVHGAEKEQAVTIMSFTTNQKKCAGYIMKKDLSFLRVLYA